MNTKKPNQTALNSVDESRRDFFKKLVAGTAFAAPLLASFSTDGALIGEAEAAAGTPYFCGYWPITDIVFRAAGRTPDNAARFSAIARAEAQDCGSLTVNLVFASRVHSFENAALLVEGDSDTFQLVEGQNTVTFNRSDTIWLLEYLIAGAGTIAVQTSGGLLSAPLVGAGV